MRNLATIFRVTATLCVLLFLGTTAHAQELTLGSPLPEANTPLQRAEGGTATLASLAGSQGTVVIFWSNQCPWTQKYEGRLMRLHDRFAGQGISFILINANNAIAFPQESLAAMGEAGYPMPYLRDENAAVAKAFGAERTPHVFVFDGAGALVYKGAIDDSPGDPNSVQAAYLADALAALVQGTAVPVPQTAAYGCMIKF